MSLKNKLEKVLKTEPSFCDPESGELNYIKVKDSADKIDQKLISILADDKDLKEKFFTKIKEVYVFNIQDFKFFLDESKINNSYTKYVNRIGLSDNSGFLENRSEVVLDFPFKDCVLEGGQSTEEGTDSYFEYSEKAGKYEEKIAKRNEIFFNQVLAHDEIDRLFDRKALVSWKRFTKDGKKNGEVVKEIKRDKTGLIRDNLIIKGNNLLALHSLKSEFTGKIKLIYIDPPYNTGNDTFNYNDKFSRSSWLTFMKNRLEIARELLADDGSIFIQCDEGENAYLRVLCDEIFGEENLMNEIIWRYRTYVGQVKDYFPKKHDTIFWYKKNSRPSFNLIYEDNLEETVDFKRWEKFLVDGNKIKYGNHPDTDSRFTAYLNRYIKQYGTPKNGDVIYEVRGYVVDDVWEDIIALDPKNLTERTKFSGGQKPEALIERIIQSVTKENDIVLDYHLGSGTTCAVAHKMNRQYIGIEQMDYIEAFAVERIRNVLQGEQGGISEAVNWEGGGEFIYCELAKWNEKAKEEIQNAKDLSALVKLFDTLYERYFLNYNVKIKDFKEKIIKEEEFKKLTLAQQKKMFLTMLDLNQMYVNESEMSDKKYGIKVGDQKLTKAFYSKK